MTFNSNQDAEDKIAYWENLLEVFKVSWINVPQIVIREPFQVFKLALYIITKNPQGIHR